MLSFGKGRKYVLFSAGRKGTKRAKRKWEGNLYPFKAQQYFLSRHNAMLPHCRATPCGKHVRPELPRPQARSRRDVPCRPFGVFRRGLCEFVSTNTRREPTRCATGPHKRSSRRLAISFCSFLVRTRKGQGSPLQKEENMYFSPQGEKIPKELLRLCLKLPSCKWEV